MDTDGKKLAIFGVCADWGSKPAMPRRIARTQPTHTALPATADLLHSLPQNHSAILLAGFQVPGKVVRGSTGHVIFPQVPRGSSSMRTAIPSPTNALRP